MECPSCQYENPSGARFCNRCATPLAGVCPSCGSANPTDARFCNQCAAALVSGQAPAEAAAPPERSPRDYTPKHLADKILRSKSALEGERKQVTVLFADVKGSMELAEQVDPEEWHRILDRFFEILASGVHRFEGTVNQYTGDGIMALFGAPIAHEDHAQRACYAALHLRDELRHYAQELKREQGLGFSVRMGVHSGEVVVGKIGDDLRMDYTAQGQTVGLAARMQELASPDTVYLTADTASLVSGYLDLEDLGSFKVKGARESLQVFELQGMSSLRTRFDVARARGLTRFVGRDDDMQALEAALARAREGNGQVVGVVAEAGVGKSRLCFEFVERCHAQGLRVYEGRGVAHGRNLPLLPILQLFRAYFGITEQDDDRTTREKIAGRLLLVGEEFREVLPLLFELLGVPDSERPALRLDPTARQRQLFGVLRKLVQSGRRESPTVTLIEDLHWIDGGSEAWLAEWVDAIGGAAGLLLVNFRPEYHADWMQKSYYRQLPLAPLGREAIRELLNDLLGTDPSIAGLAETIHQRTGGNPFFAEEVVQSLIESAQLEGAKGRYRLVTPVEELAIPSTVQSLLAARIDRLAEREKRVLQTAAVIGKEFSEPILEAVSELPKPDLLDALALLKTSEFVYEQALYPVAEYAFKHPLTQEVAYTSQLKQRRARVHGAVADAIEALHRESIEEHAALLAHHCEAAGQALAAARWAQRAAEQMDQTHPSEALRLWLKVRSLLGDVPRSAETARLGARACSQVLNQGVTQGISEEQAREVFKEGKALAELAGDPVQHAFLIYRYGTFRGTVAGAIEEWIDRSVEALRLMEQADDVAVEFYVKMGLGLSSLLAGRLRDASKIATEALTRVDDPHFASHLTGRSPYAWLLIERAAALLQMGQLRASEGELENAVTLSRRHGYLDSLAWGLFQRIHRATLVGERGTALTDTEELLRLAEQTGAGASGDYALGAVAMMHSLSGDPAQAAEFLDEREVPLEEGARLSLLRGTEVLVRVARLLLTAGRFDEARATAERAASACYEMGARVSECLAQITLAEALRRSDGRSAAGAIRDALARARELVEQTEARVYQPWILEEEARLAQLEGDQAGFESSLRQAHRLYTEMGAAGHAERLGTELGLAD